MSNLRNLLLFVVFLAIAGWIWNQQRSQTPLKETAPESPESFVEQTETNKAPTTTLSHGPQAGTPAKSVEEITSGLSPQSKQKLATLTAIFKSKNDNDSRLDTDFKKIDPELRQALMEMYQSLPMENRNERGTILFLLIRDLQSDADLDFLKKTYEESPCTSFQDCRQVGSQDPHLSGLNEASLNYPQLAGLFQLERTLRAQPDLLKDAKMRDAASEVLKRAESFPVPQIQNKAASIRKEFGI